MKTIFRLITITLVALSFNNSYCQNNFDLANFKVNPENKTTKEKKFSINTTYLSLTNFGKPEKNTHHYEIAFRYNLTAKDRIGIKLATWKLFAPMGVMIWDPLFLDKSTFYPGRLKEQGIGVTYQRTLWKRLFATVEVLPLFKTYLDESNNSIGKGFKLYSSYHVGYHIPLFKGRVYLEPQIHANFWPIDSKAPTSFGAQDAGKKNFFLFEPNLYIGVNF